MYKIRKLSFINHPVLKNLSLDFCDRNGYAVDTVLIAGENGTGKSTILNALYSLLTKKLDFEASVELEIDSSNVRKLTFYRKNLINGLDAIFINDGNGMNTVIASPEVDVKYPTAAIYSDVDINFSAKNITSVTSNQLDEDSRSRRSTQDLPTEIKQLLIDIQALDDSELAYAVRSNPESSIRQLSVNERMPRFTKAFDLMFDNLSFSRIENINNQKVVLFSKNGSNIPIDSLSSGEKQIVYRGCFLLRDVNALTGAFVLIDEPEISLHPKWQNRIMDYYKNIFTNNYGEQTSQLFVVTHSPFIIHNENRRCDKVLVLDRDENGNITVKDKPEYYKCNSYEAVNDAFNLSKLSTEESIVYLEGRTDEKYFNKTLEVFRIKAPFKFKWIGYLDEYGAEFNTGSSALEHASKFLISRNLPIKNAFLFDCDTKKAPCAKNNVYICTLPYFSNCKKMKKGIENALVLDSVDTSSFYCSVDKEGDYGENNRISNFKKMEFCDYICSLNIDELKGILVNLKSTVDSLIELFN